MFDDDDDRDEGKPSTVASYALACQLRPGQTTSKFAIMPMSSCSSLWQCKR